MRLTVYRWVTCAHTEHIDTSGQRANYYQIRDPENVVVKHEGTPPYDCPACSDPTGDHNAIGTVPVAGAAIIPFVPLIASSEFSDSDSDATVSDGGSHSGVTLDPRVQPFAPRIQALATSASQLDESYEGPLEHIAALDTDELADYDAPALSRFQGAQLAGLFGSLSTNDHATNNTVSQQQTDFSMNHYLEATQQGFQYIDPTGLIVYAPAGFPGPFNQPSTDNSIHVPRGFVAHPSTDIVTYAPNTGAVEPFYLASINPVRYSRGIAPDARPVSQSPHRPVEPSNMNTPTAPRDLRVRPHRSNKPCPENHAACHWHYADWCHKDPGTCPAAREYSANLLSCFLPLLTLEIPVKAIKAAYEAKGGWKGAPDGWNEAHESCILADNPVRCAFHQWIERQRHSHQIV
ncbi:hypothetical protein E4T39_01231 [Aureobasidium subglaciale]|nr:hypothetical protein E4T39_01231 [Aureobasidium subglaciale]